MDSYINAVTYYHSLRQSKLVREQITEMRAGLYGDVFQTWIELSTLLI